MSTPFHSKYYAHELTKRCSSDSLEKLSQSLNNATIDLNPHQVDAALFAFKSPLSRGALLADEVGLGKTIEAGLIMSQLWAEGKRRMLCIMPAALRQQWERELAEKFFIDSLILESGSYKSLQTQGVANPFEQKNRVVLCSFQFARREAAVIQRTHWDLVVMDEAHRLRNVYKSDNKIARAIRDAIGARPKILLTATPLQNSLMELYGLISFIDPHLFGNAESFRDQFAKRLANGRGDEFSDLKRRIQPVCMRTLRRQVSEYVRYTDRRSHTQDFTPSDQEWELYESVSNYLQRPQSYALPASQRALITLVLRKILASSSFAIADTLGTLIKRLEAKEKSLAPADGDTASALASEYESLAETKEEWDDTSADSASPGGEAAAKPADAEREAIRKELEDLKNYKKLAESITRNEKGAALLTALKTGMAWAEKLGAKRKALIFTESRRTQTYLKELLAANGYAGQLVTFNGTNTDPESHRVYKEWLARHAGQDCVTGSPSADIRSALVEEFRDSAAIMIATESAAEGINLQFCSLVVNYDLPWNPQRIEQRIGRCHRYGQQHDVVVINFVNRKNAADKRISERLAAMNRLVLLKKELDTASKLAEKTASLLEHGRGGVVTTARELAKSLEKSKLSEVAALKLDWTQYPAMRAASEPEISDTVLKEAQKFQLTSKACHAGVKARQEVAAREASQLGMIKRALASVEENTKKAEGVDGRLKRGEAIRQIVEKRRKDFVEGILGAISGEVGDLCEKIHPGEGIKTRLYLNPKTRGSLECDGEFEGVKGLPPQAYYSESHLDTLGVCIFLALTKKFGGKDLIVVLDDVVTSVDAPHMDRFLDLLLDQAEHFGEIVVATHYRPWLERVRHGKGPTAHIHVLHLSRWTLAHGIRHGVAKLAIQELKEAVAAEPLDRQAVASKAGIFLESLLDQLSLLYGCRLPRRPEPEYTLGELLDCFGKKLRPAMKCEAHTRGAPPKEIPLRPLLDAFAGTEWIRNQVGCHCNIHGYDVPDKDVQEFGEKTIAFAEALICAVCGSLPLRDKTGTHWQCRCPGDDGLRLCPLESPDN